MKNIFTSLVTLSLLSFSSYSAASTEVELKAALEQQQQQLEAIEKQLSELKSEKALAKQEFAQKSSNVSDKKWQINSYGSVLYKSEEVFSNVQDVTPERKATTDVERAVLEFKYDFDSKWQVELEIEYEHGGTGTTLEFDGFEEFGEFETEIEAGGEVIVEKLQVKYKANNYFTVKMGRIFVPVGLGTDLHKPSQYFSTERSWSEATLIPQVWNETGINLISKWESFTAQTLITTGLNSEYFRTYNWVATGHQKRFESVNSDDLAFTLRLDYGDLQAGNGIGVSFYTGNTSGNRNSTEVVGDGNLTIIGLHGAYSYNNWKIRAQYLLGNLDDSAAITAANKVTPGLQPGNYAQLGSEAESVFVELGYNSQSMFNLTKPLYFYTTYEYANPIKKVEDGGIATDRFDMQSVAFGINYNPIKDIVLKAQVSQQMYALDSLDDTTGFSLSMGYFFSI
jgi:hypothetical protein